MIEIQKIEIHHIDEVTKMYIALKKENFSLNSTVFNKKRIKIKDFNSIRKTILDKYSRNYYGYILLENTKIIGFIFGYEYLDNMKNDIYQDINYQIGVIDNLYLYPDYRKKGYGKQLMEKIMKEFNKHNCEIIELTTTSNSTGEKFYKKLGFQEASILLCREI